MGELVPGSVFAGHRIEAVAGRGGMGVVYRAVQLSLDRVVALKVIAPQLVQDPAIRRRFVREAKVAASLDHPNVIPIHYAGEEHGVAYIAMRYVSGDDLRTLLRRHGRLEPARAARIAAQTAAALDAAHAAGLVHRDIKPANVLLGPEDHVYLTDFGLTKHVLSRSGATRPGHWVGTLDFVAPEQIRGERSDARADVYGLGCLLHMALTGGAPFSHDGDEAKLWAHLSEDPPRPTALDGTIPPAFDAVVARALAKRPDDRYQSAGDLGRAALAAAAGEQPVAVERMVATGAAAPVEAETRTAVAAPVEAETHTAVPARERGRRRPLAAVLALGLLAGAGAVAALALLPSDDGSDPTKATRTAAANPPSLTATISVEGRPNSVAAAGGRIWVGSFHGARLTGIDARSARVVRRIGPHVGVGLRELEARGDTLWALNSRQRRLRRFDARSGRPAGEQIELPGVPSALAVGDGAVWVAIRVANASAGDQLLRIDPETGLTVETFQVRDGVQQMLVVRGALWMLSPKPSTLVRHDLETGARDHYKLSGEIPGDLAWGAGSLWVGLADQDQVIRFDPRTANSASVAVGREPAGIAVSGGRVWVANRASSTLSRIDVETGRVLGDPLDVPLNPFEMAAAGGNVWVGSLADGKVVRATARAG